MIPNGGSSCWLSPTRRCRRRHRPRRTRSLSPPPSFSRHPDVMASPPLSHSPRSCATRMPEETSLRARRGGRTAAAMHRSDCRRRGRKPRERERERERGALCSCFLVERDCSAVRDPHVPCLGLGQLQTRIFTKVLINKLHYMRAEYAGMTKLVNF